MKLILPTAHGGYRRSDDGDIIGYVTNTMTFNDVLLIKIEGPVSYTIYHHLPVVKGVDNPLY